MSAGANFCMSCGGQRAPQPQAYTPPPQGYVPPAQPQAYTPPPQGYVPPTQPQFYTPPPQPHVYASGPAPAPPSRPKSRPILTPISWISGILFIVSGLIAIAASVLPGVSTTNVGNLNAWKLGPDFTACASAKWLVFLFIYSTVIGVLILCRVRFSEWAIWVRVGLGLLYFWQGVLFWNYCSSFVKGFNGVATSAHASVSVAPALAIIAGVFYFVSALMMVIERQVK